MKEGISRGHILDIATSCVDEILKVSIRLALFAAFYYKVAIMARFRYPCKVDLSYK